MGDGVYKMRVHNYSNHRNFDGVRCEVEFDGEIYEFSYNKPFTNYVDIAEVTKKKNDFSIKSLIDSKSSVSSVEKWGIKTNTFVKVNKLMLSPNHWSNPTGNKHYFFFLDGVAADEQAKPFLNEFLRQDLDKHRKVMEVLNSKIKVTDAEHQLSGLGFSSTQPATVIVRVEGKFKRVLKVTI